MSKLRIPVDSSDHILGNIDKAKIILVEYGDYQCPYCGQAYPLVKKFVSENSKDVAFVFRNFPLKDAHQFAEPAAEIAEAAALQGKFWEMHDLLYDNQDQLSNEMFSQCIKTLKLNEAEVEKALKGSKISGKIDYDFEGGVRSGVNGTPSFFVNDQKWDAYDATYESFESLLR